MAGNTGLKCSNTILSFLASEGPNYWLNNIENLWIVAKKSSNNVLLLFSIHVVEDYICLNPNLNYWYSLGKKAKIKKIMQGSSNVNSNCL